MSFPSKFYFKKRLSRNGFQKVTKQQQQQQQQHLKRKLNNIEISFEKITSLKELFSDDFLRAFSLA